MTVFAGIAVISGAFILPIGFISWVVAILIIVFVWLPASDAYFRARAAQRHAV